MKLFSFFALIVGLSGVHAQTVALPIHFESGSVINSNFTNFDGGTGTVVANPNPSGINTTATVGRMVRNGGQVWAGAYLTTPANLNFSVNPYICMKVYTSAPVGTRIALKVEGCGGGCSNEVSAYTTVSNEWETLCYNYTGQPTSFNRLVFLFDLGNLGNGSANSTFYFDDVEQLPILPLFPTPGSQYFCPNASLNLTYPGSGNYNWYSDPAGTVLVQANSSTYTTPVLTSSTSYYVQNTTPTPFPAADLGPSIKGGTAIGNLFTVSTFFTSNLANGFFHSVDIVFHIPTGPPPGNTCTYRVDAFNLTQGTSRTLTQAYVAPVNFSQHAYVFPTPLPMNAGDQIEMRITSITAHPCYCISSNAGNNGLFLPFPNSYDPQITFTGHTSSGVSNNLLSGIDYNVSGDFIDPTLAQVNAIENCFIVLPVELTNFTVEEDRGAALLKWSTAAEINNDYFLVQRTVNGIEFETIGIVDGAGNSSALNHYDFTDTAPLDGLSYYRLVQIDFDGATASTEFVAFTKTISDEFQIAPNPTEGLITLSKTLEIGTTVEVLIQDLSGRTLRRYDFVAGQGAFVEILDVRDFPSGMYSLVIQTPGKNAVRKIMKR